MKTLEDPQMVRQIKGRMDNLRADSPRQWGMMNAHQMVCHLADSKRGVMGAKPLADASTFLQRTLIKKVALYLPLPWPKGVPTRPEMDQMLGGTKPVDFARDKAALLVLIDRISSQERDFTFVGHPIFGKMTDREWMRWAYLHCDHHLRQFGG